MERLVTKDAISKAISKILSRGEKVTRRAVQAETGGSMTAVSKTMRMLEASGRLPEVGRAPTIIQIDSRNKLASIDIQPLLGSKNIEAYVLIEQSDDEARILYFIAQDWSLVGQAHAENIAMTVMAQILPGWDPAKTIWGSAGVQKRDNSHDPNAAVISVDIASDQLVWRRGRFEWEVGNRSQKDMLPIALRVAKYVNKSMEEIEKLQDGDHFPALTRAEKRYLTPGLSSRIMCQELGERGEEIGFYLTLDPNQNGKWALFACRHGVSLSQNHPLLVELAKKSSLIARHLELSNYPDFSSMNYRMFAREIGLPETLDEIILAYADYRNAPENHC